MGVVPEGYMTIPEAARESDVSEDMLRHRMRRVGLDKFDRVQIRGIWYYRLGEDHPEGHAAPSVAGETSSKKGRLKT